MNLEEMDIKALEKLEAQIHAEIMSRYLAEII